MAAYLFHKDGQSLLIAEEERVNRHGKQTRDDGGQLLRDRARVGQVGDAETGQWASVETVSGVVAACGCLALIENSAMYLCRLGQDQI